mmetsp:Transcript_96657/g.282521  ORF Transcript_96657/g.282521 Transcript_96657/m.282521 type:complete len:159 (-) Transcript_96657:66-542(-)
MSFAPKARALLAAGLWQRTAPRVGLPTASLLGHAGLQSRLVLAPALATSAARAFCSGPLGSVEDRVIKAVKRYAGMRIDELKNETTDSTGDREKTLEALGKEVTVDTKWEDLGFDDLDKVEVLLEVEDEFNHVIPDDDADRIVSVKESVEYLQKHIDA